MYKAFLGWTRIFLSPALGEVSRTFFDLISSGFRVFFKRMGQQHSEGLFTIFVTILPHLLIDQDLNLNALLPMVS